MKCVECNTPLVSSNGYYVCPQCGLVENEFRDYENKPYVPEIHPIAVTLLNKVTLNNILEHKNSNVEYYKIKIDNYNKLYNIKSINNSLYNRCLRIKQQYNIRNVKGDDDLLISFFYVTMGKLPIQYYYEYVNDNKYFKYLLKRFYKVFGISFMNATLDATLKYIDGVLGIEFFYPCRKILMMLIKGSTTKPMLIIHYLLTQLRYDKIIKISRSQISKLTYIYRDINRFELKKKIIYKRYYSFISTLEYSYEIISMDMNPLGDFYDVVKNMK